MSFRAQLEGCHSELNSRNATCLTPISSSTQGTPASRPLRYPRSLVDQAHHNKYNTNLLQQNRLAGDTYREALRASRPPGGCDGSNLCSH
ncbi:hypothetical protein DEO72_LG3g975 [Vigna unguiculata]|uniref:Uncharacterized protein n=1 Tax=Vigna unguiculata TaxID=3917 RepID=A0A4D6LCY9_VIGUN|nr:hypothetical protein DEO72_LG3g975 [Vigna unguiculata]